VLCATCRASIHPLGSAICPRCSIPSLEGRTCQACLGNQHLIHTILAGYAFEGPLRSALLAFKYRGQYRLAACLGEFILDALEHRPLSIDLVAPVPLNPRRMRERGFNQSELLARTVAAPHQWQLDVALLARIRDTPQQARLPARERRANVAGAFQVTRPQEVAGRRVLLVDDVTTTGATLDACAAPLLAAGAEGVWAVVAARDI
jgi:ComF family protein